MEKITEHLTEESVRKYNFVLVRVIDVNVRRDAYFQNGLKHHVNEFWWENGDWSYRKTFTEFSKFNADLEKYDCFLERMNICVDEQNAGGWGNFSVEVFGII